MCVYVVLQKALFCFPIPFEYVEGVTGEQPFV